MALYNTFPGPGVLPVCHSYHDLVLYISHDVLPRLWSFWWLVRYKMFEVAWLYTGGYSPGLYLIQILDNIVDHLATAYLELLSIHL